MMSFERSIVREYFQRRQLTRKLPNLVVFRSSKEKCGRECDALSTQGCSCLPRQQTGNARDRLCRDRVMLPVRNQLPDFGNHAAREFIGSRTKGNDNGIGVFTE